MCILSSSLFITPIKIIRRLDIIIESMIFSNLTGVIQTEFGNKTERFSGSRFSEKEINFFMDS